MKTKKLRYFLLMLLIIICFNVVAQPLRIGAITVDSIFFNNELLYFKSKGLFYYSTTKKELLEIYKERGYNDYIGIPVHMPNENVDSLYTRFVYNNDTMAVMLLYHEYSPLKFEIKKMHFIKGIFIIDLHGYFYDRFKDDIKNDKAIELPVIIENFPYDCLEYRIEDQ